MSKLNGASHSPTARMHAAQERYKRMSLAQKSHWVLSELGPVLILAAEELNPDNLPLDETTVLSFKLDAWGKKAMELAGELSEGMKKHGPRLVLAGKP